MDRTTPHHVLEIQSAKTINFNVSILYNMEGLVNKFSDNVISGQVDCNKGVYTVSGTIHWGFRDGVQVLYRAAEPADLRLSIKGSALPFPNPKAAFGNTNSGHAQVDNLGRFTFQVLNPNSYYKNDDIMKGVGHGKILVQPILYVTVKLPNNTQRTYEVDLGDGIPLRSLTNYPGKRVRSTGRNTSTYFY